VKGRLVVLGAAAWLAMAALPGSAAGQAAAGKFEETGRGASVLIGAGAGLEPGHLSGVLQGHVGVGWRGGSNLVAAVSSISYSYTEAFFGSWSVSRKHLGFGLLGAHWLTPSWHVHLQGLVGPGFDTLSGTGILEVSQTAFAWSAGLGAGWRWLSLVLRYQGGRESISGADGRSTYEAPGGVQLVLTATADVLRAGK